MIMFLWIQNVLCACSSKNTLEMVDDVDINEFDADPLGWSMRLLKHPYGEFSMAAVQANENMEDISQLEIGNNALFVGIYDGKNGTIASNFLVDSLFQALLYFIYQDDNSMSKDVLRKVVAEVEKRFMLDADNYWKPERAQASSSCLFCLIWNGKLYVANVGGSHAVMGSLGLFGRLYVQQLVRDYHAGNRHIQKELMRLHPDDPDIVMYNADVWRVRGVSEVSRCIGNAYLKRVPFTLSPSFQVPQIELARSDFTQPLLSPEPEIYSRVLRDNDKFIIFGSGVLWKLLTNEEATKIVNTSPREGITKRIVRIAQEIAARKKNITYIRLLKVPRGSRLDYHDDIAVSVVYLDKKQGVNMSVRPRINSFRSFFDTTLHSNFHYLYAQNAALCLGLANYA